LRIEYAPKIGDAVSPQLKLIALDAEDLAVVSAHVQDARVQTSDIIWRQSEKRLVIGMNRPDWEQTLAGETSPRRLIAALRFDRVLSCKSRNIDRDAPEAVLELVGIEFHPGEAPGGSAVLMFSRGEALRLDVECLECELSDLGEDDLAADPGEGANETSFRGAQSANPESRDSGSGPSDHPGMTEGSHSKG
jgi:hypothetical protein